MFRTSRVRFKLYESTTLTYPHPNACPRGPRGRLSPCRDPIGLYGPCHHGSRLYRSAPGQNFDRVQRLLLKQSCRSGSWWNELKESLPEAEHRPLLTVCLAEAGESGTRTQRQARPEPQIRHPSGSQDIGWHGGGKTASVNAQVVSEAYSAWLKHLPLDRPSLSPKTLGMRPFKLNRTPKLTERQ